MPGRIYGVKRKLPVEKYSIQDVGALGQVSLMKAIREFIFGYDLHKIRFWRVGVIGILVDGYVYQQTTLTKVF